MQQVEAEEINSGEEDEDQKQADVVEDDTVPNAIAESYMHGASNLFGTLQGLVLAGNEDISAVLDILVTLATPHQRSIQDLTKALDIAKKQQSLKVSGHLAEFVIQTATEVLNQRTLADRAMRRITKFHGVVDWGRVVLRLLKSYRTTLPPCVGCLVVMERMIGEIVRGKCLVIFVGEMCWDYFGNK